MLCTLFFIYLGGNLPACLHTLQKQAALIPVLFRIFFKKIFRDKKEISDSRVGRMLTIASRTNRVSVTYDLPWHSTQWIHSGGILWF